MVLLSLSSEKRVMFIHLKQRGISLVELILFIVIMGVALGGILAAMNRVTSRSVDTLIRKQALAVAESLLEEVALMPFTFCDPDDPTAATAANPVLGAGDCSVRVEALGLDAAFVPQPANETRYSNTSPFDNVNDYNGCQLNAAANAGCDPAGNGGITDIVNAPITSLAGYNANTTPEDTRFVLTEDLLVKSADVQKLSEASRMIGDLLKSGVVFSSDAYNAGPSFIFTGVNALKGEMLTEATKRAREAAEKFATESGAKVGDIQNANQGIIEINPAVEIPNDRPDKQIDKKVRVVTTISYFLVD